MIVVIFVTRCVQAPSCGREDPGGELELEQEVGCLVGVVEEGEEAGLQAGQGLQVEELEEELEESQVRQQCRRCLTPVWTGQLWHSSG